MNLIEKINNFLPIYETVLPFSKQKVNFTPFKVKDLKNISIILQENNKKLSLSALVQCLENNTNLKNIEQLCLADAEYLFLQLRAKSIDEVLNLIVNGEKCNISISEIKTKNDIQTTNYKISDELNIILETPKISDILSLEEFTEENYQKLCVKKIFVKNELYEIKKYVPNEIKEILNNLPAKTLQYLNEFIQKEPSLFIEYKNQEGEVAGPLTFFTFA